MKQFTKWVLAAFVLGVCIAAPRASAQNYLINGNFETEDASDPIPGWVSGFNGPDQPLQFQNQFVITNPPGVTGLTFGASNDSHVLANFFDGTLQQDVNLASNGLSVGQQLTLSGQVFVNSFFWDAVNGPQATTAGGWTTIGQLQFYNGSGGLIATPVNLTLNTAATPRDTWASFSGNAFIPATAANARVILGQIVTNPAVVKPSSPTGFDNISLNITGIPEPSTYAMLALGLGVLIPVVRRKLKK